MIEASFDNGVQQIVCGRTFKTPLTNFAGVNIATL
jgi:hypothetical protein